MTRDEAIALAESGVWKEWTDQEIVVFQLYEEKLCMDFSRFHEAVEKVLGRPVWTHEFAEIGRLRAEFEGTRQSPTIAEIMGIIPPEKLIVVKAP
jgi:hypothetical protein